MNYPQWICYDCGMKHGKRELGLSCWHEGKCNICGVAKPVTDPRNFGHLKETWKNEKTSK